MHFRGKRGRDAGSPIALPKTRRDGRTALPARLTCQGRSVRTNAGDARVFVVWPRDWGAHGHDTERGGEEGTPGS